MSSWTNGLAPHFLIRAAGSIPESIWMSCGTVEFDVGGNMLLWDAVVWSSGERAGVELFRVAPPVTEQMHAEPGAPQQIAWEQLMDLWNRSSRSN